MLYLATGNDNRDPNARKSDRGVLYGFNHQECADNPQRCIDSWSFPDSRFSHEVGPFIGGPVAKGETVVAGSSDGILYAVSASEGDPLWEFRTGDKIWSTPAVAAGVVYVGSLDHFIYAISLADGRELWRFETGGAITGTPLVVEGRVYVGSFDRNLYILDTDSGQELGRVSLDGWIWAGPVTDETKNTIYVSTLGETFYALVRRALDRGQRQERWPPVPTSGSVLAPPAVLADQLIFTDDKGLRIVRRDGRPGRRDPCSSLRERVRAGVVAYQGLVYVIDQDRKVHTIDPETCRPVPITGLDR
jgi:outer membrane protein assembly factor BamB